MVVLGLFVILGLFLAPFLALFLGLFLVGIRALGFDWFLHAQVVIWNKPDLGRLYELAHRHVPLRLRQPDNEHALARTQLELVFLLSRVVEEHPCRLDFVVLFLGVV